jgi:RNA recognition motif-containing protein
MGVEILSSRIGRDGSVTRIYVGNLRYDCREDEIKALCEEFGPVTEIFMPKQTDSEDTNRGFCFVEFMMQISADRAIFDLNGMNFQGRTLKAEQARERT